MQPVIYADTLFLFNFFMNTIILLIAEKLLNQKAAVVKIVISAAMGAVYSVLMFFPEYGILYSLILKIIVIFGLEYMVFGGKTVKAAAKNFVVFLLINLCMGGALMALIFLTNFGTAVGAVVSGGGIYLNLSPLILLLGITGTYIFLGIYRKMCRRRLYEKSLIKRVCIEYKGKTAEIDVFLDTGCRVCDPVSDKGVIIAEYEAVKLILSEKERCLIEEETDVVKAYGAGLEVLPFSTINGSNMIYAFVADYVRGEALLKKKVMVGMVTDKKFGGEYHGLINPELLLKDENTVKEYIAL